MKISETTDATNDSASKNIAKGAEEQRGTRARVLTEIADAQWFALDYPGQVRSLVLAGARNTDGSIAGCAQTKSSASRRSGITSGSISSITDSAPPRAGGLNKPIWTPDGKGLIAVYSKEGKRNLGLFDATAEGNGS